MHYGSAQQASRLKPKTTDATGGLKCQCSTNCIFRVKSYLKTYVKYAKLSTVWRPTLLARMIDGSTLSQNNDKIMTDNRGLEELSYLT